MIRANEPEYNFNRPPIILQVKLVEFICRVCNRPGLGAENAKVHQGHCREEWNRRNSKRTADRNKRRRQLAEAGALAVA